jgi:hypothetical protein
MLAGAANYKFSLHAIFTKIFLTIPYEHLFYFLSRIAAMQKPN